MPSKSQQAGALLYREYREKKPYSLMKTELAPMSDSEAYDIQKEFMLLRAQDSGGYSGYKIAYTTKVMQERVGASEPVFRPRYGPGVVRRPGRGNGQSQ